jgi:PKD repeat protein
MKMTFTKPFLAFLLLFINVQLYAQTAHFQWGKRGGSGGSDFSNTFEHVIDIATDTHGNVYVLASNSNSLANVDGHSGISVRDKLSLASWDCGGHFRWMKTYGSASVFNGTAIGVDTLGGVYMTGSTISNNSLGYSYFDADTTLGNTNRKMFIIKYDTSGHYKWIKMPEPATVAFNAQSSQLDISIAPNGDIYWFASLETGGYDNNAYTISTHKYCVVKYNKDGVYQNIAPLDVTTTDGGNSANLYGAYNLVTSHFAHDNNSGKLYLSGPFDPTFGSLAFGGTSVNATGGVTGYPFFVAAFDATGLLLWAKQSDSNNYASTFTCRPVLDEQGNVYVAGGLLGTNHFSGHTFTTLTSRLAPFVVSIGSNGTLNWASNANAITAGTKACGLAYRNNVLALTGPYAGLLKWDNDSLTAPITLSGTNYVFLARLNANTGTEIGMDSIPSQGTLDNVPSAVAADGNGNFYIGGLFDNILYPGNDTITSVGGSYDWFVAKFGSATCNCTVPLIAFTNTTNGSITQFTATINVTVDSVVWDYGDGTHGTGNTTNHTYANGGTYNVCATAYNSCGSNTTCQSITITTGGTGGTGISNTPGFEQINIYPNPTTQQLIIENATNGTQLAIYDISGKLVIQQQLNTPKEWINVSTLSSGMYLIRMTNKDGKQAQTKLMKQ